jgi:hypothetical protein
MSYIGELEQLRAGHAPDHYDPVITSVKLRAQTHTCMAPNLGIDAADQSLKHAHRVLSGLECLTNIETTRSNAESQYPAFLWPLPPSI